MVQLLIDNDLNVNSKDYSGYTLIHTAICSGNSHKSFHEYILYIYYLKSGCDNVEILTMLIKNGANIDAGVRIMLLCSFRRCKS